MIPPRAAVAMLALLSLVAAGTGVAQETDEFRWSGTVSTGQTVEIHNMNGPLTAESASGNTIEVVGLKEGPSGDLRVVDIEVIEHAGGVTICSIYPRRSRPSICAPGDEADLGSTDDNKTRIEFTVRVPAGVRFAGNTMNGAIRADGLDGDVELMTMNGAIEVSTRGWARAKTMNGAIDASFGATDWDGDIELETMNGAVTVRLPSGASTEISARTMNGRVDSDWDLERRGWRRNRASGTIGSGGRSLSLSTMNGSVRIRRRG